MRVYFSGIGGVGLGPLALIALDAGHEVMGSDLHTGLTSAELESKGVRIEYSQNGDFLQTQHQVQPIDWFVYTAALPSDHPELTMAKALGIRVAKRDELLLEIIQQKNLKLLAVAGTHGKTTTTGMLAWTLRELGLPVSYCIGTTLSWGPSGHYEPSSEYFVYECDEFDRNFLKFRPYCSLITSIEWDHPDTYPTEEEYKAAFRQFIHQSESTVMWQSDSNFIGTHSANSWCLQDNEVLSDLKLAGEHNRRNGTLVLKALELLKIGNASNNLETLQTFPGTNRRMEKLANKLYSDYGHTPTEIKATLQLARELSDHVVLVYQPHQNIRQHEIRAQYTDDVFTDASEVYWLPTYLSREKSELEILTPEELTKNLKKTNLHIAEMSNELQQAIEKACRENKLILCMGAGDIDDWIRKR